MSRLKLLTVMLLIVVMIVGSAAGCGKTTANNSGSSAITTQSASSATAGTAKKEDYTLTYMIPGAEDSHSLDDDIGKAIYDDTGVIIDIKGYSGNYDEKCTLALAAGDYPDMIELQGNPMVKKYIQAGALLNLDELMDKYAPNFKEFHKDSIPYWRMVDDNGILYKFEADSPRMDCATGPLLDMLVRSDILEQQGWPEVLNEDSWIDLLKQGLKQNPTVNGKNTVGMVLPGAEAWGVTGIMSQMYDKGKYTEAAGNGAVIWNSYDEVFEDVMLHPYFKDSLKFFNRCYRESILDPECFTDFSAQVDEKLNSGRALSAWYYIWTVITANTALHKAGLNNMDYIEWPIMTANQLKNGDKKVIRIIDSYDWRSVAITKNAKDPQRLMELLDWASTDEHQVLLGWGIKDKHYTIGSDGKRTPTEEYFKAYSDTGDPFNKGIGAYNFLGLSGEFDSNGQSYNISYDETVMNILMMPDRKKSVYSNYGWTSITDPWHKNKNFGTDTMHTGLVGICVLNSDSDESKLAAKLVDFRTKNTVPLVMAESDEEFESLYKEVIKKYETLKPQPVIDKYNELYRNVKAKFTSNSK